MNVSSALAYAAAFTCSIVALAAVIRARRTFANWSFAVGMFLFAIEALLTGFSFRAEVPDTIAFFQTLVMLTKAFLPGVWLMFSLTYSRANYREFLARSRFLIAGAFLLPILVLPSIYRPILGVRAYESPAHGWMVEYGETAKILNALILVTAVLILMNFERTFRAAVGTMRWRIKFLLLGLIIMFGARIYTRSQSLLFSGSDLAQGNIETAALLLGCTLITIGYMRSGFVEIDIYPSRAALRTSLTLLLVGSYLFVVGILAQIVAHFGGASRFPLAAFLVLLALAVLAVLLLSDRLRLKIEMFVSRHFKRPAHDFRQIWTRFTQNMSAVLDETNLCATSARLISEIFSALSVSVWLHDEKQQRLICVFSTAESNGKRTSDRAIELAPTQLGSIVSTNYSRPFRLEKADNQSRQRLREVGAGRFLEGGDRICVPLRAGEQNLGLVVLADRVNATYYTPEEMDLLKCIGDDVAASLLNLRLTRETLEQKELEAFQTMSAFFIHDLKNAASTLGLTLQNLPTHFEDPEFRKDALRGIKGAADRINDIVGRLATLRQELRSKPTEVDLNSLVMEKVREMDGSSAEITTKLETLPFIIADGEQLGSVITNLILNAKDAIGARGQITIETKRLDQAVMFSVSDTGCGMTVEFLKGSLFRPFHTTKKGGLGIGMFQAKMIVEAHRGNIRVKSSPGAGTTFQIILPLDSNGR